MADSFKVAAYLALFCFSGLAHSQVNSQVNSQVVDQDPAGLPLTSSQSLDSTLEPTLAPAPILAARVNPIHHSLRVVLDPFNQSLIVEDTITFPESADLAELETEYVDKNFLSRVYFIPVQQTVIKADCAHASRVLASHVRVLDHRPVFRQLCCCKKRRVKL